MSYSLNVRILFFASHAHFYYFLCVQTWSIDHNCRMYIQIAACLFWCTMCIVTCLVNGLCAQSFEDLNVNAFRLQIGKNQWHVHYYCSHNTLCGLTRLWLCTVDKIIMCTGEEMMCTCTLCIGDYHAELCVPDKLWPRRAVYIWKGWTVFKIFVIERKNLFSALMYRR